MGCRLCINFDVYGCWFNPMSQDVMECQFQQHREVMRAHMDEVDPGSKLSVFKWAFAHGWIKIENECDVSGRQVNLQGLHLDLKRSWPFLRRDLLHVDNVFIDIEDMGRHIRWNQYNDREKIRNFDIDEDRDPQMAAPFLGFAPCYML